MPAKVGVLALQGDLAEHAALLADAGHDPVAVRCPEDLAGVDALVLPGGESTTMSLLMRSAGLDGALRERLAAGLPALGTCAGMILLGSEALDGREDQICFGAIDLVVRRNAFGRQAQSFECDLDVSGIEGGPMHAVFIRAPVVERAGPGVEVLATLPTGGSFAPVVCRQGPVLVAAFHPELAGDARLHEMLLREI